MIAPRSSCPGEECYSSPGRSRSSDQYEINNSNAQIGHVYPRLSDVFFFPPPAVRLWTPVVPSRADRSPSFPLKPVPSGKCPVTATQHWRRGPRWPAKMAPSTAAANSPPGFLNQTDVLVNGFG